MIVPRVLALCGNDGGGACNMWRVWQPMAELQRRGQVAEWTWLDETPKVFPLVSMGVFDAVILPRLMWKPQHQPNARRWVNSLHRAGLAVIYEVDDDVFNPQIAARQRATTEPDKTLEELEQDRRGRISALRLCDGVTVGNELLARVVAQYVDTPVRVVPNHIDVRWWRRTLRGVRRVIPPLTIGWAGGARYQEDLEPLAEAWHNLANRYPDVQFVVQGYMAEVLIDAVPEGRVRRLPWMALEEYPRALLNIDIGCASVADKHFNRCKTPIKVWEYTLAGAVVVASPTLYGPVTTDGEDSLVAETAAEWETALSRLIEDAQLRRRLWRAQRRRLAEQHSLENHVGDWPAAWQQIIDQYRASRPKLALAG